MSHPTIREPEWLISSDLVPYEEAQAAMTARVEAILGGTEADQIWLLEHPPLYTGGTSAKDSDLLMSGGLPIFKTGRGGQYTYHGPGQRILYAMMDLREKDRDLRAHVWRLEEWIIRTLAEFDVVGMRREGRVGVWVETQSTEKKIAALGVRARRWVTSHGLALNVNPDLSHYAGIVPCGVREYGVTSLHEIGKNISISEVDLAFKKTYKFLF